jgi:hypothetical protein
MEIVDCDEPAQSVPAARRRIESGMLRDPKLTVDVDLKPLLPPRFPTNWKADACVRRDNVPIAVVRRKELGSQVMRARFSMCFHISGLW